MFYVQVIWMDKKGAGRMRSFCDEAKLNQFLQSLRLDADIRNRNHEIIGNVWADAHDGNRGKWRWAYDAEAAIY